ncbi:MAG: glycosyltransferase, partial [Rhodospirillales bacterium]|nr:glycosyltransferase [Rhodospirillales bacterium]
QSLISHHITAGPVVDRWDSWRFWESLAAGCATVHLDFQKYGFLLPEMPRPFQHYLPIDLENPSEIVCFLRDQPEKLAEIASAGRDFALQYYSPDRVAARFLSLVCS